MKIVTVSLALAVSAFPISAQSAPRVATTLSDTELSELDEIRKDVWVDWFSGDTAALRTVLGPELVAMSVGTPHWQSLDEALAASARFKAEGGRFLSVSFESPLIHRFGETVVMFSQYTVVTEVGDQRETLKGRATEVFVRTSGRWVHTSWHLDTEAS